jgi:hypothetical protein
MAKMGRRAMLATMEIKDRRAKLVQAVQRDPKDRQEKPAAVLPARHPVCRRVIDPIIIQLIEIFRYKRRNVLATFDI